MTEDQDRHVRQKAFHDAVTTSLRDAVKLKRIMLERGKTRAKAKCPECEGYLHGALAGPKNHIRMWCDGSCKRSVME